MSDQHRGDLDDLFDKTFLSEIDIEKYVDGQSATYEDQMKMKQKFVSDYNITKNFPQHIDCVTSYDEYNTRKLYTIQKQSNVESNINSNSNSNSNLNPNPNSNPIQNPLNPNMISDYKLESSLETTIQRFPNLGNENNYPLKDNVQLPKSTFTQSRFNQMPTDQIIKPHLDNTFPKNQSIDAKSPSYQHYHHQHQHQHQHHHHHHQQQQQQQQQQQFNTLQHQQYIQQPDMQYKLQNSTYRQNNPYSSNLPYQLYPVVPSGQSFRPNQSLQSTKQFQQPSYQLSSNNQNYHIPDSSQLISQPQLDQSIEINHQKSEIDKYKSNVHVSDPKIISSTTTEQINTENDSNISERTPSLINSLSKSICGLDLTVSKIHLSNFTLYNKESEEIKMEFLASLDGKFYVNNKYMMLDDDNDDDDHKTFPIACYRRNYSTMLISIYFSDIPKYLEVNGLYYEINNTRLSLDAKSNFSQSPIELAYFENSNPEKQSPNVVVMNDSILDLGTFKDRKNVKMQRFQFKRATPNNGKNIAKDYYYLFVTLSFDLVENNPSELNKRKLPFHQKIMTLKTNSISVRGRNPSFYTERNDESINRGTSVCYKYFNGFVEES